MILKEIKVELGDEFKSDSYLESGIFIIDYVNNKNIVIIDKKGSSVFLVGLYDVWGYVFEEVKDSVVEVKTGNITESFALKMLALSMANEETKNELLNK